MRFLSNVIHYICTFGSIGSTSAETSESLKCDVMVYVLIRQNLFSTLPKFIAVEGNWTDNIWRLANVITTLLKRIGHTKPKCASDQLHIY